jgi:hypothetical protein
LCTDKPPAVVGAPGGRILRHRLGIGTWSGCQLRTAMLPHVLSEILALPSSQLSVVTYRSGS